MMPAVECPSAEALEQLLLGLGLLLRIAHKLIRMAGSRLLPVGGAHGVAVGCGLNA